MQQKAPDRETGQGLSFCAAPRNEGVDGVRDNIKTDKNDFKFIERRTLPTCFPMKPWARKHFQREISCLCCSV